MVLYLSICWPWNNRSLSTHSQQSSVQDTLNFSASAREQNSIAGEQVPFSCTSRDAIRSIKVDSGISDCLFRTALYRIWPAKVTDNRSDFNSSQAFVIQLLLEWRFAPHTGISMGGYRSEFGDSSSSRLNHPTFLSPTNNSQFTNRGSFYLLISKLEDFKEEEEWQKRQHHVYGARPDVETSHLLFSNASNVFLIIVSCSQTFDSQKESHLYVLVWPAL